LSIYISNAYESLLNQQIFGGVLSGFTVSNWIMLNLPTFILIVSVLGAVGLFVNMIRTGTEGNAP
jgi:hypothetical protein